MRKVILFLVLFLSFVNILLAEEYIYILSDENLSDLYFGAKDYFKNTEMQVFKDVRGVVITFKLEDVLNEYSVISYKTLWNLEKIEYFLAKNKNPAIIEVHTAKFPLNNSLNLKNWEISTVVANRIEAILLKNGRISQNQIKSIGYGEFLPSKNTPYNGVKNIGRVDIIILCSISGE